MTIFYKKKKKKKMVRKSNLLNGGGQHFSGTAQLTAEYFFVEHVSVNSTCSLYYTCKHINLQKCSKLSYPGQSSHFLYHNLLRETTCRHSTQRKLGLIKKDLAVKQCTSKIQTLHVQLITYVSRSY